MAVNVVGAVEVPLNTFSGLVTELSPSDLPGGVSPDNADVIFIPGSVSSREGLQRVFSTTIDGTATMVYGKSCVMPTGEIRNLYLTSNGNYYVENPVASPGVATLLTTVTANSYSKSITAFGREYIATSNGLHGTDVPLQWDGTFIDRVTQDGPGTPPIVANFVLPPFAMIPHGGPAPYAITTIQPTNLQGGYYSSFAVNTASTAGLNPGDRITIAGNSNADFNGVWYITSVFPTTIFVTAYFPSTETSGTGGTITVGTGFTMVRTNNIVTVYGNVVGSGNNLIPGYKVQITGVPAATAGGVINTVKINNEDNPGEALITTSLAHGLLPGNLVSLTGIAAVGVGGGLSSASRQGGITTFTTTAPHGLTPGSTITTIGVSDNSFNSSTSIVSIPSATTFTIAQSDVNATATGGTVLLDWPVPETGQPTYFEVLSVPSPTTFLVAVNYADGNWTGGLVNFPWDGIFLVKTATATSFTYQQYGPNNSTTTIGQVIPSGQAAPGLHQCQVLFLTRQGYITRPSPPTSFLANGGQYIGVSNIPIGPSNVVARILAFTGANGALFYYIPTQPQTNGQPVGTATQINDNTTTFVILDFSDNTLFAATGINLPGNNLPSQIVLDGALGFGYYGSRLITYGQRNCIQNLLNMGFDGGHLPTSPTAPTGWTVVEGSAALTAGHFNTTWQINVSPSIQRGTITQNAYEDVYGAPIATPNTQYTFRAWVKTSAPTVDLVIVAELNSAIFGGPLFATIAGANVPIGGGYAEAKFSAKTPSTIPSDYILTVYAQSATATVTVNIDDMVIIYSDNPYTDGVAFGSYINNPEGFDGLSGKFGPVNDTRKIMDFSMIRDNLYLLTQDPSGRLHQTSDNGTTEPAGWTIREVGSNCGLLSAFSLAKSQADDSTASGGEEWFIWASASGARIFGGDQPYKISQEIQPDWQRINPASLITLWALNDPIYRRTYFGLPQDMAASPNVIYVMDYRELDTAPQIADANPIHTNMSGRQIAVDRVRKWTKWNLAMNSGSLMYRGGSESVVTLMNGNTQVLGAGTGFGNAYTLSSAKLTDDDYGQIYSYYWTYFFVSGEEELQLQLGGHRKMVAYMQADVLGLGTITIQTACNTMSNIWPYTCTRTLALDPTFDLEYGGANATAQRFAFKFFSSPITGTDNFFKLHKFIATMRPNARIPVRGSAS